MATEDLGLPLLVFSGDIKYVLELETADKLIEEIMLVSSTLRKFAIYLARSISSIVRRLSEGEFVVGFDIEWPVFTKENKTAILQICCTEKEVYVFHLSSLGGASNLNLATIFLHYCNIISGFIYRSSDVP